MGDVPSAEERRLQRMQQRAFDYFLHETNPANGLVRDKTASSWPASIAATALALSCYPVVVERGFVSRAQARARVLATLRFFRDSEQGESPDSTGYRGFYYHFLDMRTGRRAWRCELSTVDTAFLVAGMLCAAQYFDSDEADERELRSLAHELYERVDWKWALGRSKTIGHGWRPESGISAFHFGLNLGPNVLTIENHRSGFVWALMRGCAPLVEGLRRAGFEGGWLGAVSCGAARHEAASHDAASGADSRPLARNASDHRRSTCNSE